MAYSTGPVAVYLEVGKKRTIAGAVDWPGWCRAGRSEEAALQALFEYAPRYEVVLESSGFDFQFSAPRDASAYDVVERLKGNTTTDFGAPDVAPSADTVPVDDADLQRLKRLLQACWTALDSAVRAAQGKELRKGPRGGGRDLEGIFQHVLGAEASYLSSLGGKLSRREGEEGSERQLLERRRVILEALGASARGEFPLRGPRGGTRWTPRYFVRRAAWHILDHVWEIQDRAL